MRRFFYPLLAGCFLCLAMLACVQGSSNEVMIITATPPDAPLGISPRPPEEGPSEGVVASPVPDGGRPTLIVPTLDPLRVNTPEPLPESYSIQPGDTLTSIAARFGTSVEQLLRLNNLELSAVLSVGQVLQLPTLSGVTSPTFKIIPDSELVRSPATSGFDVAGYINGMPGYLRTYTDTVDEVELSGAAVIQRVADDFSVNPRLLIALLEYRSGWLLTAEPAEATLLYPMGYRELRYEGLYKQLSWTANRLNWAYYGWRLRDQLWFEYGDGVRVSYGAGLNAGAVAVQYILSRSRNYDDWLVDVSPDGFYSTYLALFGDPFSYAIEPLLPLTLTQPEMLLPWSAGETWYYTGGPHGAYGSGSAWGAVDFAPPGDEETRGCFIAPQWTTAVADGIIARSGDGFVVLDLDFDGDETTGWTVVYLHLAEQDRIAAGATVQAGDPIGYSSCEGGVSNATHIHLSRRYNGEWISAHCHHCAPGVPDVPFNLGGWILRGLENQEYQGYMVNGEEYRQAEQGRNNPLNELSW